MSVTDDALWAAMDAYLDSDPDDAKVSRERMRAALAAALERYTADDLRDTPAGRALLAEGWGAFAAKAMRVNGGPDPDFLIGHVQSLNPYRKEEGK